MECPRCKGKCLTTNSYGSGTGSIRSLLCQNPKCRARIVVQSILQVLAINPKRGNGAVAMLKKQPEARVTQELISSASKGSRSS